MPGSYIEHVMLKYLINHKRGAEPPGPTPKSALAIGSIFARELSELPLGIRI